MSDETLQSESMNLIRSLRVVELEEERQASRDLNIGVIQKRRREAWLNVLKYLIVYAEAVEAKSKQHDNS